MQNTLWFLTRGYFLLSRSKRWAYNMTANKGLIFCFYSLAQSMMRAIHWLLIKGILKLTF